MKTTLTLDGHAEIDNGEQSYLHISEEITREMVVIILIFNYHRRVATQWNIIATLRNYAHSITSKTNQNEFVQIEREFLIKLHVFVMFQIVTVL